MLLLLVFLERTVPQSDKLRQCQPKVDWSPHRRRLPHDVRVHMYWWWCTGELPFPTVMTLFQAPCIAWPGYSLSHTTGDPDLLMNLTSHRLGWELSPDIAIYSQKVVPVPWASSWVIQYSCKILTFVFFRMTFRFRMSKSKVWVERQIIMDILF